MTVSLIRKLYNTAFSVTFMGISDWFKKENLVSSEEKKFINPIKKGMLVPDISTMKRYKKILLNNFACFGT